MSSKDGDVEAKVEEDPEKEESGEISAAPSPDDEPSLKKEIDNGNRGTAGSANSRTSKLGRKGDPRMHRAVAARLSNPEMTLLEALRAGGFNFPECDEKNGTLDGTIVDSDNVQLCQRKNQLSRRLRLARQSKSLKSGCADTWGKDGVKISRRKNDDEDNGISSETEDRLRILIQQTQQRAKANHLNKKRKVSTGGDDKTHKRMLSDEVEVVEEDPYEEEIGADTAARRARNHPLFQHRQPTIPTTAWGAADQLGFVGMAANAASLAAAWAAGQTTAAQQLQAAAAYGVSSVNTAAGTALAMAQARGGAVPVAAQHSFSFWPSLSASGAAVAQRIFQQQQQAQAQQQKLASGGGGPQAVPGRNNPSFGGANLQGARSPSLALTAASLGMSQDQLAVVLGGGGVSFAKQGLPSQQSQPGKTIPIQQQAQTNPLTITTTGPSSEVATTNSKPGTSGGLSDNLSSCSSLSAKDQVDIALRQAANGSASEKKILDNERKMTMALDFLRSEFSSLLKRCMLTAGFEPSHTEECDWRYLEFAERAANEERNRIAQIRAQIGNTKADDESKQGKEETKSSDTGEGDGERQKGIDDSANSHSFDKHGGCFAGRHIHRLNGRCGHQAVIHQPEGGQPHVDFLVDDKIECYSGVQGINPMGSLEALWPSKFSCDQLMCESLSDPDHEVMCGVQTCVNECDEVTKKMSPTVLELSNINFENDKEWNKDTVGDDTLMGLIALGEVTNQAKFDRSSNKCDF